MPTGTMLILRVHMADKNRRRASRLLQEVMERMMVRDSTASMEIVDTPVILGAEDASAIQRDGVILYEKLEAQV